MKTLSSTIVIALVAATPALAGELGAKPAAKAEAISINPSEIKWGDPPPTLPKGAQMAVLHGDPSKKAPFTVRFKAPAGYKIPPHWHSKDEQLTILSGTFVLHMGDTMDAPAHELGAGSYHFLPAKMHHAAETKGPETVVQVDGMGPFDINYLNPADVPNKSAALTK
jgi:quercetin dioxygenase-like cupin family protein